MNLTDSDVLKFQKGTPFLFKDICLVHSKRMGEIVDEGYDKFQEYLAILTMHKPKNANIKDKELRTLIKEVTDFQYILLLANLDLEFNQKLSDAFRFFCLETQTTFSLDPAQIVLGPIEEEHFLTEENFYDFQDLIRKMYFLESATSKTDIQKGDNDFIRDLKNKFKKRKETLKSQSPRSADDNIQLSDLIGSITLNDCGLNMINVWDITYYAFHDQLKRMGWRDQFNINHSAALAGAKVRDEQLKHWIRSMANSD